MKENLFYLNKKLKNNINIFVNDESAILNPILTCIFSLAIVVIMYYMFMPLLWYISNTLIMMGAPAASTLFFMKMAMWGFFIFGISALVILIASVWKKTHDTGKRRIY
jgi:hypothetical protein